MSPVVAETAHTDGTRVGQYKWDYLEIPEPRLPWVFLDLAEEARNVKVDSGRPGYTEEVQPQGTGLCYCYGRQSTCTKEGDRESHQCLYRDDTNHGTRWAKMIQIDRRMIGPVYHTHPSGTRPNTIHV